MAAYVDVGLANISRNLERMSGEESGQDGHNTEIPYDNPSSQPYSVVFIARTGQPPAFNAHFPQMVAVASKARPDQEPTRLVGFSKACDERLSAALGIPRASSVALRTNAPQAKALVTFVLEHVAPPKAAWLDEAKDARYLQTRIISTETTIGAKRQKKT